MLILSILTTRKKYFHGFNLMKHMLPTDDHFLNCEIRSNHLLYRYTSSHRHLTLTISCQVTQLT
jgi:hypothetical protein